MKKIIIVVAAVVLALLAVATFARAAHPHGAYCGSALFGEIKGKVSFPSNNKLSLAIDAMDDKISCPDITYSVDHATGMILLPDAKSPSTCLGKVLENAKIQIKVHYLKYKNVIQLDTGVANLELKQC